MNIAVALLLCLADPGTALEGAEPEPSLAGIYSIFGTDSNGGRYVGAALLTWAGGGRYVVQYATASRDEDGNLVHSNLFGSAVRHEDALAVSWGVKSGPGLTIYRRDGTALRGAWVVLTGGLRGDEVLTFRGRLPGDG